MTATALDHPFAVPPEPGSVIEVAPGLLWARLSLPFRLDHINIYLIENDNGWTILDTGLGDEPTKAAWQALVSGPLRGVQPSQLIVTHLHPDHIGLAGWLCETFDMPLLTSLSTWYGCLNISLNPNVTNARNFHDHYLRHGLDEGTTEIVMTQGHHYLEMVQPLPSTFKRLVAGDRIKIGRRDFRVLSGDGHAPEQIMLYCEAEQLFFGSDQVLAKITPNVSVWAEEPTGNPLGLYLRSLAQLNETISPDALVLPGHQLPFRGLQQRSHELAEHHASRCRLIAAAASERPHSVAELVPVMFTRALDPHQLGFAFSEAHAHVNYMVERDELAWTTSGDGVDRVIATDAA